MKIKVMGHLELLDSWDCGLMQDNNDDSKHRLEQPDPFSPLGLRAGQEATT